MAAEEKGTFDATYTSMHGGFLCAQVSIGSDGVLHVPLARRLKAAAATIRAARRTHQLCNSS
jgi:hypothetical protein